MHLKRDDSFSNPDWGRDERTSEPAPKPSVEDHQLHCPDCGHGGHANKEEDNDDIPF